MVAVISLSKLELLPLYRVFRQTDPRIIPHHAPLSRAKGPRYWVFGPKIPHMKGNYLHRFHGNPGPVKPGPAAAGVLACHFSNSQRNKTSAFYRELYRIPD
jgi:hypothetical protein